MKKQATNSEDQVTLKRVKRIISISEKRFSFFIINK